MKTYTGNFGGQKHPANGISVRCSTQFCSKSPGCSPSTQIMFRTPPHHPCCTVIVGGTCRTVLTSRNHIINTVRPIARHRHIRLLFSPCRRPSSSPLNAPPIAGSQSAVRRRRSTPGGAATTNDSGDRKIYFPLKQGAPICDTVGLKLALGQPFLDAQNTCICAYGATDYRGYPQLTIESPEFLL